MRNYKKSLLSVAAAAAISATSLSAGYVPLTTTASDNKWVVFGVTGINTDGTAATDDGVYTIANSAKTALLDAAVDDAAASGMNTGDGDLVQVKALDDINIEVRVDTTYKLLDGSTVDVAYLETDPVRTMYVKHGADTPNFAVSYVASLEGKKLEYKVDGSKAFYVTLDSANTFNNPSLGLLVQGAAAVVGNEQNLWTEDETHSVIDYDMSDNPTLSSGWIIDTHKVSGLGAKHADTSLRVYTYDAQNAKWEIYDSRNTANTNDFTDVVAGKAYWAKVDAAQTKEVGLVLGAPKLTTADYANAGLTDGWNFIAFDAENSSIRNSSTGMLVTLKGGGDTIDITDSSGNHTITITPDVADTNIQLAKDINQAVAAAKLTGALPSTFELRAFPTNASSDTGQIAILCNKKFTIAENSGDLLDTTTTLTGDTLIDPTDVTAAAPADVTTAGAMSKYGEYAMVIEPLVSGVADSLASNLTTNPAASVQIMGTTTADDTPIEINVATAALAATELGGHTDITATAIDLAIDGTASEVILASANPFTVRDHTFTRVYKVDGTGVTAGDSNLEFTGGFTAAAVIPDTAIDRTVDAAGDAIEVATIIHAAGTADKMSAQEATGKNEVVIVSDTLDSSKFLMTETGAAAGDSKDYLQAIVGTTDLSKGAVKNVYSLNYLSKIGLSNTVTIAGTAGVFPFEDNPNDTVRLDIVTEYGTITGTVFKPNESYNLDFSRQTDADNKALFDLYVTTLNADLTAQGFQASAEHDYVLTGNAVAAGNIGVFNAASIVITGSDVKDITPNQVNDAVGIKEVFTVTFGPSIDADTIDFDGSTQYTDAGGLTAIQVATAYQAVYDGANWVAVDNGNGTITFTAALVGEVTDIVSGAFTVGSAGAGADITVVAAAPTTQGAGVALETALTALETFGNIEEPSGDLSKDLQYNSVLTPDYVTNGPLYTMRDNNMTLKALVTGTTDLATGDVTWESIDLTRKPSEWLKSQDYNLFDVDSRAGYWAYLATDDSANPITIETPLLTASYQHHFDSDTTDLDAVEYTTHNYFNGDIEVTVNGLSDYDSRKSSRVRATIGGETFELTKDPLDENKFNGSINVFEANGMTEDTNYEVSINVVDGLGNSFTQSFSSDTNNSVLDNKKPSAPSVTIDNGELTITSTDSTVTGYYVFGASGIPEKNTADYALAVLGANGGNASGGCSTQDPSVWDAPTEGITVIAVDGNGTIGKGNISDAVSVDFMPIMKNRALVQDTSNAGEIDASTGGNLFDSTCAISGPIVDETGVTLTAITSDTIAKLAYASLGANANNDTPVTVYVSDTGSAGTIAKITFPEEYAGTDVFVELDGLVYGYQLPTKAEMDNGDAGVSTSDPVNLKAIVGASNPKTGITL